MTEHPLLILISWTCAVTALAFLAGWRRGTLRERARCMAIIKDFNQDLARRSSLFAEDARALRQMRDEREFQRRSRMDY